MIEEVFRFEPRTSLMVDAMYFHVALRSYSEAMKHTDAIIEAEQVFTQMEKKLDRIKEKYDDERHAAERYEKIERLAIQMERAEYDIGVANGPYLQGLAVTHIMCAAALESHINICSKEHLHGKMLATFERFPHDAKWLFLPRLLGATGFDPGKEPYQNFAALIGFRNKLMHYKGYEEKGTVGGTIIPGFLKELGLHKEAAGRFLQTVQQMLKSLAEQLDQDVPHWLNAENISYFEFRFN